MGDRLPKLSEASVAFLRSRVWRGNVRELQNVIEHVAVLAEPDQLIQPNDIPIYDDSRRVAGARPELPAGVMDEAYHPAKDRVIAQFEKEYLTRLVGAGGRQHVEGGASRQHRPHHALRLMDKHEFQRNDGVEDA